VAEKGKEKKKDSCACEHHHTDEHSCESSNTCSCHNHAPALRMPVVAGSFYPADKSQLVSLIEKLLKENNFSLTAKKLGIDYKNIRAAIVPHAGYVYSGPTAAVVYNAVANTSPKRVVLLGPSHQAPLNDAYSFSSNWLTPLGEVKIDNSNLAFEKVLDDFEHSLEVQLPFLQTIFKKDSFTFTPIIYGEINEKELAKSVAALDSKNTLFLASSDLSHYLPYTEAKVIDAETIEAILALDIEKFMEVGDACGKIGIAALMILAKKNKWKAALLDYRNSGDTAGDKKGVVGYAAIIFVKQ